MKPKKILLVCVGRGYNRTYGGYYNRYKVLVNGQPIEKLFSDEELKNLPYWVNRSQVMAVSVWGSRQEFEAKLALARFLKIGEDLEKTDWAGYCRMIEGTIEAIY